jgi:outer membrane protein TolC
MDRDTAIAQIQLMYPLYTGGKISSIINQASLAKDIAKEEYQRSTLQVIRDVKRYYYAVQLTQRLNTLVQDTLETLEDTRELTQKMYEAGSTRANKLDYLKTVMAVQYTRSLASEFSAKHQSALAALQLAMGVPMDTQISIANSEFPPQSLNQSYAQLFSQAQQFNPQMNMMKLAVNISDAKIIEAKSAYYPQVVLTGNIRHIENAINEGIVNEDNRDSWTIGVAMSMPIFDFGRTSHHVNTATLESKSMGEKKILVEQGLAAQIKYLFIQLDAANQQIVISEKATQTSKEYEELTEKAYQIGVTKPEDMIQASLLDAITQGNLLKAEHDAAYQLAEIEYFIGNEIQK